MKVRKRSYPLDMLNVEQGSKRLTIHTHRQTICAYVTEGDEIKAHHEFTFDQLCKLFTKLQPGIHQLLE